MFKSLRLGTPMPPNSFFIQILSQLAR
uniref:Uncharacterized protein n=1 Tax=Arundo donax TaxID=35708 RepID=A0A0A8YFF5_ARUDO